MNERYKIIQMFSGGLDSILAARILIEEGFDVIAVHFYTGFNALLSHEITNGPDWQWEPSESVMCSARKLGIRLVPLDLSGEFKDILLDPRYGYGSAANPCIDCRIFTLIKARQIMDTEGAILVSTGEVLGQRPMTQFKRSLRLVEKRSGLEGRLLRPLSARLLDPTIPEREGIVNRERLYDIEGRSRKRQIDLAKKFGIDTYPSPAGGCLLTDRQYDKKFKDLVEYTRGEDITLEALNSLKTGRHMRIPSGVKIIVGRTEPENDYLARLLTPQHWNFMARDYAGATVFVPEEPAASDFPVIAEITARYGKGLNENSVTVIARKEGETREFTVKPVKQEVVDRMLVC